MLLNSDTIVTDSWLERLVACAESDPKIGIVGPLSNTASWQSVPELTEDGDWATNRPPESMTPQDVAALIAASAGHVYPRMSFLNGFCLLIRRELMDDIGIFDEEMFGAGYGEENDYCVRARNRGWQLAVADDAYVYHAQSRSYSSERRLELAKQADVNLRAKYGDEAIDRDVYPVIHNGLVLAGIRARTKACLERAAISEQFKQKFEGRRLAIVLPVCDAGGGSNVVLSEAMAMRRFGVDVRIINLAPFRPHFEQAYPLCDLEVVYASDETQVASLCEGFDAVVATLYKTVYWLAGLARGWKTAIGYYVQDYEPYFFAHGSTEYLEAVQSYDAFAGLQCLAKTRWTRDEVLRQTGVSCKVVGASLDIDLFQPRRDPDDLASPLKVLAMIRPESPRRAACFTLDILNRAMQRHGSRIEVTVFGTDSAGYANCGEGRLDGMRRYGKLRPEQCAALFSTQDIFVDFSTFQAMGLTAMECMATGCAVIVPARGGASAYAVDGQNALIVDTSDHDACLEALNRLVEDADLRRRLRFAAAASMPSYYPEKVAGNILQALFGGTEDLNGGAQ